jgi:hypothetical protein
MLVKDQRKGSELSKKAKSKGAAAVKKSAKDKTAFAKARGAKRGSHREGSSDAILVKAQPPLDPDAEDEGLTVLVQTGLCRRKMLTLIFGNKPAGEQTHSSKRLVLLTEFENPRVLAAICDSKLLDRIRPGNPKKSKRQAGIKKGVPCKMVQEELHRWRVAVKQRGWNGGMYGPAGILPGSVLDFLSLVGPITTRTRLFKILSGQYQRYEEYGEELWNILSSLDIPPMVELPKKTRKQAAKRPAQDVEPCTNLDGPAVRMQKKQKHGPSNERLTITIPASKSRPVATTG